MRVRMCRVPFCHLLPRNNSPMCAWILGSLVRLSCLRPKVNEAVRATLTPDHRRLAAALCEATGIEQGQQDEDHKREEWEGAARRPYRAGTICVSCRYRSMGPSWERPR
jgi:hypothetical protein